MGERDGEFQGRAGETPVSVGNHGALTSDGLPVNPIYKAIREARPPSKQPKATREPGEKARYVEHRGRLCRVHHRRDGTEDREALCNFTARIVEEVIYDDGEETRMTFAIEGSLCTGAPLPRIDVSAASFAGMAWIPSQWGIKAVIQAGQATKDHVRVALQELSVDAPRRTVYGHTGWRRIGEAWHYLHGGGALGADGNRPDIEVVPGPGTMAHYRLPDPPEGAALAAAVRASLALLDIAPRNPALGALLLAGVYRAPLAVASPIKHAAWIVGRTGAGKSSAVAVTLAHFGAEFSTGSSFPASWVDSPGSLERKAHAAKDAMFVPDDFKPRGSRSDIDGYHAKADRLIHDGVGNQAGRGRLTTTTQQRAAYHARGFVLVTGEDLPRGESLQARMTIVTVKPDPHTRKIGAGSDIDGANLTALHQSARAGILAQAMAGFLRWLAPRIDDFKTTLPDDILARRTQALNQGIAGHARNPEILASLTAGLSVFFRFAVECGALDARDAQTHEERAYTLLYALLEAQDSYQGEQDEVKRFLSLLASALASGRCHIFDLDAGGNGRGCPNDKTGHSATLLGWHMDAHSLFQPQGVRIGWIDREAVYLEGEAAYAVAKRYAAEQGAELALSEKMLFARIHERGLLAKVETDVDCLRLKIQKRILGTRQRVYALNHSALFEKDS
jgi:hypothetical protein